jgi:hypothetical protein
MRRASPGREEIERKCKVPATAPEGTGPPVLPDHQTVRQARRAVDPGGISGPCSGSPAHVTTQND